MSTVLRECSCCGLEKPWDPTQKRESKASGFSGALCWWCFLDARRGRNREANRRYREANPEASRESNRRWQAKNPDTNRRRSIYSAPEWDRMAIIRIETQARQQGLGIDHIFALKAQCSKTGLRASGLHRSWNLQPMDVAANKSKGNRFDFKLEEQRLMDLYYKNRFEAQREASNPIGLGRTTLVRTGHLAKVMGARFAS